MSSPVRAAAVATARSGTGEKRQLLGELGRLRLEEEASLWKAAEDRIVSGGAPDLPGWQVDLHEFLSATGLLVAEDGASAFSTTPSPSSSRRSRTPS